MNQTSTSLPGAITPSFSLKSEHNINFGSQDAGEFCHYKFLIHGSSHGLLSNHHQNPIFFLDMNFEKISKGKTTSFSRLPIKSPETIRRNHSETLEPAKIETCRKSTISFNFDIGIDSDDILTSVLAVMDKLNTTRLNEDFTNGNIDSGVIESALGTASGLTTTGGNIVPEERIYDEGKFVGRPFKG